MKTVKILETEGAAVLMKEFGFKNVMQAPKLTKIVISSATGTGMKKDRHRNDLVVDRLTKIAGQKPSIRQAKQSIASFKIREGDKVGVAVTLRGAKMHAFIDKLIHIALPRTKDFRGLDKKGVDVMGNYTFGIKEQTIFPEIRDEELKDIFSMAVTLVTSAKNKEVATRYLEIIGLPFKKEENK